MVNSMSVTTDTLNVVTAKQLLSENGVSFVGMDNATILSEATKLLETPQTTLNAKNEKALNDYNKRPDGGNVNSWNSAKVREIFGVENGQELVDLLFNYTLIAKVQSYESAIFAKLNLQASDIEKAKALNIKEGYRLKLKVIATPNEDYAQTLTEAKDKDPKMFDIFRDGCLKNGTTSKIAEITGFVQGATFEFKAEIPQSSTWVQMVGIA